MHFLQRSFSQRFDYDLHGCDTLVDAEKGDEIWVNAYGDFWCSTHYSSSYSTSSYYTGAMCHFKGYKI